MYYKAYYSAERSSHGARLLREPEAMRSDAAAAAAAMRAPLRRVAALAALPQEPSWQGAHAGASPPAQHATHRS